MSPFIPSVCCESSDSELSSGSEGDSCEWSTDNDANDMESLPVNKIRDPGVNIEDTDITDQSKNKRLAGKGSCCYTEVNHSVCSR